MPFDTSTASVQARNEHDTWLTHHMSKTNNNAQCKVVKFIKQEMYEVEFGLFHSLYIMVVHRHIMLPTYL